MVKVISAERINEEMRRDPRGWAERCEADYAAQMTAAADAIEESGSPLCLLTGPSGSGKTTSARMIEDILDKRGHETHTLSMDNYYHRPDGMELPVDEKGDTDLESPLLLDAALLQKHLGDIAKGIPVEMPTFDFAKQRRSGVTIPLERKPGEIIIMEGIHALNPSVVGSAIESAQTIYVSARTRIAWSGGMLHPSNVRVLRRMLRDRRGRGQSIRDTAHRLWSVDRGERLYIMPNKHNAKIEINTSIPYEICLYRALLQTEIEAVHDAPEQELFDRLASVLREIEPMDESIPAESALVREFIGGSSWER